MLDANTHTHTHTHTHTALGLGKILPFLTVKHVIEKVNPCEPLLPHL